ncbi:hydroxymethylglutaryl-synthase [Neofusicoccum parvum]|nr:hydroxymethylglutaryl-synthase [Neofusicoccum parvum]
MQLRAQNVGIKAIEIYFPNQCVDQAELETHMGVPSGKFTIGLGQMQMAFCDDREDTYSLALTAVSSLLRKYSVDPRSIGRLEVGTESPLDKSKSCKTVLMQLFEPHGNTNIEGCDTFNACYGGTNALFNTINWLESSSWDGRDAIVVAGDIALYDQPAAKPTGGAGCVAMLVGPNAPLIFDTGLRGSHFKHTYDFYKADFKSEYPLIDGQYSIQCYTQAIDACYKHYHSRKDAMKTMLNGSWKDLGLAEGEVELPLDYFDYMVFHAPTCKLVEKSFARLMYNDFVENPDHPFFASVPAELRGLLPKETLTNKTVEKTFVALAKKRFAARVSSGLTVPAMCGNTYTASVYGSLISLMTNVGSDDLQGKRIGLFSYGSGLASSLFSLTVRGNVSNMIGKLDLLSRLKQRHIVSPEGYDEACKIRENYEKIMAVIPPFLEVPTKDAIPKMRQLVEARQAPVLAKLTSDTSLHYQERTITGPRGEITLSILSPATITRAAGAQRTNLPCVLFLHGGGMISGSRLAGLDMFAPWVAAANSDKCAPVVVSVEYRLAPKHPHPTPVDDCYAALRWVTSTAGGAGEIGIDPSRVVLAGAPAGGGLATAAALMARDQQAAPGPRPRGLLLVYPMLDDRSSRITATASARQFATGGVWSGASNELGWASLLGDEHAENVSIYAAPGRATAADLAGLPPVYMDVGSADVFRDEDVAFAARLWESGARAELHVWPGAPHAFDGLVPGATASRAAFAARWAWFSRLVAEEARD